MKITAITQQVKRQGRYSIFVDEVFAFSLSAGALLDSHIIKGQELSHQHLTDLKRLSDDAKRYDQVLRYVALRQRSRWEIETYLKRKDSPAPLIEQITNKLIAVGLIDDSKFAQAFVNDRRLLRPASRRKITADLQKKHVSGGDIRQALGDDDDERSALTEIVIRKRRQTRYQDDQKLIQYLARQGFAFGNIKQVLGHAENLDDT